MNKKPIVGISTCLLGEKVRYDGGHKLNHYLKDNLGMYVDFYPVCPEVECGLSVPREAMRLVEQNGQIHLMTQKSKKNMTLQMKKWMKQKLKVLSQLSLCGFIFKSKSPSSGLFRVKIYHDNGNVVKSGSGLFAKGVLDAFPLLPVEDDGRLNDHQLRENFIERIFVMKRYHTLIQNNKTLRKLMDFHASHKYLLMAHSPQTLKELGAFIAKGKMYSIEDVYQNYFENFLPALKKIATVKKNTNVLHHIMGYFKKNLNKDEKEELLDVIDNYHQQLVPLIVPITLLNHYVRKYQPPYLENQFYLNPHPMELMLRNHV